jgi:hypothetical protein
MALRKAVSKPPRRVRPQPASPRWRRYLNHAVLFLLACLVYANALGNGFVTDDRIQVVKNPLITSIRHIPEIFTTGVLNFFGATANYYRPIHYLVYMLLYRVNGADAFPFHLFLVLLHAANTVLVYMLVRRMLAAPEPAASGRDISLPAALASAALFAIHPIHTEVVDWIAAVPDALVTAVMVFAFWLFLRQGASPRGWRIAAHAGLYLLALLTKEPGAMLLPLYVTYEWICLGRRARALVRNAALYGAMLASLGVYLAARVLALGSLAPAQQNYHRLTPVEFLLSVIVVARQYLGELAWPAGLNYFHLFEPARGVTPAFLASLLVLAALGAVDPLEPPRPVRRRCRAPARVGLRYRVDRPDAGSGAQHHRGRAERPCRALSLPAVGRVLLDRRPCLALVCAAESHGRVGSGFAGPGRSRRRDHRPQSGLARRPHPHGKDHPAIARRRRAA